MTSVLTICIIIAVIGGSMVFASYMYYEYQPNFILVESGQPVQVGPVIYAVEHLGMHEGDDDIKPEEIFFKIQIIAENVGASTTLLVVEHDAVSLLMHWAGNGWIVLIHVLVLQYLGKTVFYIFTVLRTMLFLLHLSHHVVIILLEARPLETLMHMYSM